MILEFLTQNSNKRLEELRKREQVLRAQISEEAMRRQRRLARDHERLTKILGDVVLRRAAQSPEFENVLRQTVKTTELDETSQRFMKKIGWL